ncbi:MAG: phosphatidate cytidylyltransferase [Tissierellaceae bacterium]|nr:phosphatidate cytidylyltransferase [Tissierellaceae bacterium]
MKDLKTRALAGVIGLILLIFIVLKGELYLSISLCIVSIIGLWEFYKALNNINIKPINYIGYIGAIGIFLTNVFQNISIGSVLYLVTAILLIILLLNKKVSIIDVASTILGVIYIPFFLSHIYKLDGMIYIWLVFLIAFGTDTFAYLIGNLFGKHKLSPKISPNKTKEGAIGGILGSFFITLIFGYFAEVDPLWKLLILSIIASIVSQAGDLVASRIKRLAKIKDYGFIIPGHGGILDRFDSIIFCAPLIYYYVIYILI